MYTYIRIYKLLYINMRANFINKNLKFKYKFERRLIKKF